MMKVSCLSVMLAACIVLSAGCAEGEADASNPAGSNESQALEYPWSEDDVKGTISAGTSATMATSYYGCTYGCDAFSEASHFVVESVGSNGYEMAVTRSGAPDLEGGIEEYTQTNSWAQALVGDWPFTDENTTVSTETVMVPAGTFEDCVVYTFIEESPGFARCCGNPIEAEAELESESASATSAAGDRFSFGKIPETTWIVYFSPDKLPGIPIKIVQNTAGLIQIDELVEYELAGE